MIEDEKDLEISRLKLLLEKKQNVNKSHVATIAHYSAALAYEKHNNLNLVLKYNKLADRFNANFKFHEYIFDVLDQTANLMENYDAVREQEPTVQKRVQAAGRKRRTRKSNGTPAGA